MTGQARAIAGVMRRCLVDSGKIGKLASPFCARFLILRAVGINAYAAH